MALMSPTPKLDARRALIGLMIALNRAATFPPGQKPHVLRELRVSLRDLKATKRALDDDQLVLMKFCARLVRNMADLQVRRPDGRRKKFLKAVREGLRRNTGDVPTSPRGRGELRACGPK